MTDPTRAELLVAAACGFMGSEILEHRADVIAADIKYKQQDRSFLLSRARALLGDGWRPIETAPKDGTPIDVWLGAVEFPRREIDVRWREPTDAEFEVNGSDHPEPGDGTFGPGPGWFSDGGWTGANALIGRDLPTHWRPLPAPPSETADG